jgi:hypothetical protein
VKINQPGEHVGLIFWRAVNSVEKLISPALKIPWQRHGHPVQYLNPHLITPHDTPPVDPEGRFALSRQAVWSGYKELKANQGSVRANGQLIEEFDKNLVGNLYKLWNRMV